MSAPDPLGPDRIRPADRELLEDPAARETWRILVELNSGEPLPPDGNLEAELGLDSIGWLNLALQIEQRSGVEWTDEAVARVRTVRDLLLEVAARRKSGNVSAESYLANPEAHLSPAQKRWLKPLDSRETRLSRALHATNRAVIRLAFRLRVTGRERVPAAQVLLAPTHGSFLDPLAIAAALDHPRLMQCFWAADEGIAFGNPLNRSVSRLAQAVPFDAEHAFIAGMTSAAAVLQRGFSLIWFPEGRRARNTELQPFRPGIGALLERFPVPVVPVAIRGAHEAYPPGRILPRPHPITVAFGDPLEPFLLDSQGEGERSQDRITHALWRHTLEFYMRTTVSR